MTKTKAKTAAPKDKPRDARARWKEGESGNLKGAPRKGMSWSEIIKEVSDYRISDVIATLGPTHPLSKRLKKLPKEVQLKYLVSIQALGSLALDTQHGLWTAIMDRSEGRPNQSVELNAKIQHKGYVSLSPDDWDIATKKEEPK